MDCRTGGGHPRRHDAADAGAGCGARSGAGAREGGRRVRAACVRHLPHDGAVFPLPAAVLAVPRPDQHQRPRHRHRRRRPRTQRGRIYAAYATSGVWKTDDNGATWQAIFENQPSTSIGDIAVAPSNPDILWVGTGESNLFRASMPGVGVFKSTDGGRTFSHAGLTDTQTIARIVVHPTNPDIVYVASAGHAWTDNEMRGVFKTTDGGKTWTKVLYKSPRTGAIDLVMDPSDPNTLYAATWQRMRRKWSDPRVEPGLQRKRHLEDDGRREDVGRRRRRAAGGAVPRPHRPRRRRGRTRTSSTRSSTTTRRAVRRGRTSAMRTAA